ncbi:MAG TPA: HAMP domain-containing sensor histidine kinase [Phototrophicaceae bacterium]|nr:HAMP domain-containing sensor histidine kinase [Phototrophicaceae bacterium]
MSLATAIHLLASLSAIAAAAALLLNLAVQSRRDRVDGVLALFSAALLLWGLAGFLPGSPALAASLLTLTIGFYFIYLTLANHQENRVTSLLTLASPVLVIVNLLLIWGAHGVTGDSNPVVTSAGEIVFILLTIYAAVAFWAMMIAGHELVAQLRGVGLMVIVACAAPLLLPDLLLTGSLFLMAAAALWIGWVVIRAQINRPISDLREEIRVANRDLRQAVSEVSALRANNDSLNQQLQVAGQYSSDFLDNLGHKLRTPLNSITGYTELLQSGLYGELNDRQQDRLGKIERNSENLLDLISNMLDLNKLNAGRLELTRATLALNPLIEQVVSTAEARQWEKGVRLKTDLAADLPNVSADEARICQVITQIVDNALKFTMQGEVTVCSLPLHVENGVSAQFTLPFTGWLSDGDWVALEVSDTGIGIAPEAQAQIFDAFFQVADPRSEDTFGTGLGLTIAKKLTELHDGRLWVKSVPEQGSTFYLALHAQHK